MKRKKRGRKSTSERLYKTWYETVYAPNQHDNFYESSEWRALRRECFYRDRYTCVRCDKRMRMDHLTAHHILPRDKGGSDNIENLVTLCTHCHDFVEIQGYKDKASIIGSYQEDETLRPFPRHQEQEKAAEADSPQDDDPYHRPEWHKWVYGGMKRQ